MLNTTALILLITFFLGGLPLSRAQDQEAEELDIIELELEKNAPKPKKDSSDEQLGPPVNKENVLTNFSGLGTLSPFSEISVIQKRFLPKTGRFQFFGGLSVLTNNPFYNTVGVNGRAGYFLTETWGVEVSYFGLSTAERKTTEELRDIQGVKTENLVFPESFSGVDIMFVPIYGKLALFNERIIPFDLYFSAGVGQTKTQANQNVSTVHLATGQVFAISKAYAARWDLSWNTFSATGIDGSANTFNNLFITLGMSWFFPEASYR